MRLILLDVSGGIPGIGDMSNQGQPCKYSYCIGENEEGALPPAGDIVRVVPAPDNVHIFVGGSPWNLKPNGDILLSRLQERLNACHELKSVVWKHRPSGSAAGAGVLKDLEEHCDAVLNALAD